MGSSVENVGIYAKCKQMKIGSNVLDVTKKLVYLILISKFIDKLKLYLKKKIGLKVFINKIITKRKD